MLKCIIYTKIFRKPLKFQKKLKINLLNGGKTNATHTLKPQ